MPLLVKGTFYRLLYMGFTFCIGLLFAHLSGKFLFGTISLMTANMALLVILTGLGHDASLVWHRASGRLTTPQAFSYASLIGVQQLLLYLSLTGVYFILHGRLLISQQPGSFGIYELLYFLGIIFLDKYVSLFYAVGHPVLCNRVLAIASLSILLMLVLAHLADLLSGEEALQLFCVSTAGVTAALAVVFHGRFTVLPFSLGENPALRSFFYFSLVVFVTNLIQFMAYRADYWFIDYYFSRNELGVYAQANRFAQLLWVLPNIVAALIAAPLASRESAFAEEELERAVRMMNLANLLLAPLLLLASWLIYRYWLTEFLPGWSIIPAMLAGFYFFCNTLLLAAYFSARKQLGVNLTISAVCLLLIVLLDYLLIPRYGLRGAGWANAIAYTTSGILSLWVYCRQTRIPLRAMFFVQGKDWQRLQNYLRLR